MRAKANEILMIMGEYIGPCLVVDMADGSDQPILGMLQIPDGARL